jgi:hypothetical protein
LSYETARGFCKIRLPDRTRLEADISDVALIEAMSAELLPRL